MNPAFPGLFAPLLLAGCGEAPPAPENGATSESAAVGAEPLPAPAGSAPKQAAWVLTSEGLGPLRIGMSVNEITAAAGADADPAATGGPEPEACDQFRPQRAPKGVLVMVEASRLTRISLTDEANVRTDRDIAPGDRAAAVRQAYGPSLVEEPHKYVDAPAAYLTHWAKGSARGSYVDDPAARGIRYEIAANRRVQAIHAGGPSIQYVEGCA